MFKSVKRLFVPDATSIAARLLAEARLDMLTAQHAKEHWTAQVDMLSVRLHRLQKAVASEG